MNTDMPIEFNCPLGNECERVVTDEVTKKQKMVRCRWFVNIKGKHPQSEEIIDQFNCAIAWGPLLTIETTQQVIGVGAATESFRNEVVAESKTKNLFPVLKAFAIPKPNGGK